MISIDRKVSRDILSVTKDYNVKILFDPALGGFAVWHMSHPDKANRVPSVPITEVSGALERMEERGMIKKIQGTWGGSMIFCITPELLHAKAFWWDRFSKKFWGGFAAGIAASVASGLILQLLQGLF